MTNGGALQSFAQHRQQYVAWHFEGGMNSNPKPLVLTKAMAYKNADGGFVNNATMGNHHPRKPQNQTGYPACRNILDSCKGKAAFLFKISLLRSQQHRINDSSLVADLGKQEKLNMVRHHDQNLRQSLGQIMGEVEELDLVNNTCLVYMSDNGGVPASQPPGSTPSLNHPLQAASGMLWKVSACL